ncbi:dNA gyrase B subunit C-terminal domain protein [Anaerotruncus sp. CAG:390]|nr:dNA gyrase B subunit C-terminal domain protein [Anaerotruncus sp. CAG:390]
MAEKAKSTTAKKTEKYNDQSIVMLKGADRVRLRPSVIFGSDGLEGCEHAFFEILSNSVDEAREGYGSEIKVTVFEDHSIEVDDHGRGIPLDFNEKEGRYNWDLIFCEPYAGGKMNNNAESASYEYSLGLNGLGAFATQCASKYMEVDSFDGKYVRFMSFRLGSPVGELGVRELSKGERRTGTVIRWLPDRDVFTDVNIPKEFFVDVLRRQAVVNAGVKFIFLFEENGEFTEQVFYNENGIRDYVAEVAGTSALTQPVFWHLETQGRDREDKPVYRFKADISFCVSQTVTMLEYYHNASFLEHGGSPDRAVRVAFVYAIDKYLKSAGKYNKNESKITFADIADCLVLVISSNSTITSYENQTKKAITNAFIYEALTDFIKKNLEIYFTENPTEADKIAAQVLVNKRSRENAERTRLDIKKKLTGSLDVANRVEKFVNCRSKDPAVRELYIVEGDSALTSCKLGRAAEFQAIIPVRGKTLNCLKSTYDKIFKNDIIVDLLKVIGCGAEVGTRAKGKGSEVSAFSLESLRWSKIIICTDADEDGFQIRTLLLTLFYRLLPTLLKEGKVFIAETPLFEITTKDRTLFAFDEFEKAEILKKLGNQKYTLQRSKGLGENEPEMMWETTMNPATRRLVAVTPTDAEATERIFDTLLGDNLPARKKFITENGDRYMKDADI